jgi:serine/threonine-protein kinase RsbW
VSERLTLRIPASPEYLVLCRLALTGIARLQPMSDDDLSDLKLALTEAASNSMRHAYAGGEGTVEVRIELAHGEIAVEVLDDGPGFEPPPASDSQGDLDEGGLGLAIIEAVVDGLAVGRRRDGRGSLLRFTKRLAGSPPDDVRRL